MQLPAPYIIIIRDARYWLVGPFASPEAAADYGAAHQMACGDDPRWQSITLDSPHFVPLRADPAATSPEALAAETDVGRA